MKKKELIERLVSEIELGKVKHGYLRSRRFRKINFLLKNSYQVLDAEKVIY